MVNLLPFSVFLPDALQYPAFLLKISYIKPTFQGYRVQINQESYKCKCLIKLQNTVDT